MPGARDVGLIVAGLALLTLLRRASEREAIDASTGLPEVELVDAQASDDAYSEPYPTDTEVYVTDNPDANLDAFLYALRLSEHTRADVMAGRDWTTFYGGAQFADLSDHPVLTGELRGVPLPPEWCRKAGYASGQCVSTAAGAYQINVPTWNEVRDWGGPRLPDFSSASQSEAARRILRKIGAADYIERGDLANGLRLASSRWASLPGSRSGQGQRSMEYVLSAFNEGLGQTLA